METGQQHSESLIDADAEVQGYLTLPEAGAVTVIALAAFTAGVGLENKTNGSLIEGVRRGIHNAGY